jgi:hypothetical protein
MSPDRSSAQRMRGLEKPHAAQQLSPDNPLECLVQAQRKSAHNSNIGTISKSLISFKPLCRKGIQNPPILSLGGMIFLHKFGNSGDLTQITLAINPFGTAKSGAQLLCRSFESFGGRSDVAAG